MPSGHASFLEVGDLFCSDRGGVGGVDQHAAANVAHHCANQTERRRLEWRLDAVAPDRALLSGIAKGEGEATDGRHEAAGAAHGSLHCSPPLSAAQHAYGML